MAASPNKISTFTLPDDGKVINSDWRDDIDTDFAIYGGSEKEEREYIDPEKVVTRETQRKIDRIKAKKIGATTLEIFENKVAA